MSETTQEMVAEGYLEEERDSDGLSRENNNINNSQEEFMKVKDVKD